MLLILMGRQLQRLLRLLVQIESQWRLRRLLLLLLLLRLLLRSHA